MKSSFIKLPFNLKFCFIFLFLLCLTWLTTSEAVSCDSCGRECASACGTKHFRTCCFNYLRKRSSPPSPATEIDILTDNNDFELTSSIEQNLANWLRNTKEIENVIRKAINLDRMQLNKKKKINDENIMDF